MNLHPATRSLIESAKEKIAKWKGLQDNVNVEGDYKAGLADALTLIIRAIRDLESNLFVVLVFGPLKSGKSTFVNCLLRREVSPTRLGISATKRPSIILEADDQNPAAEQYFPVTGRGLSLKTMFEQVVDYLRNVTTKDDLSSYATITPVKPFEKVVEMLSMNLAPDTIEPLITAIRLPKNEFLRDGVAIVDSPGFDDPTLGLRTPEIAWAIENADFCILVYSSLAAANQPLLNLLKEVLAKASSPPLWLIQNRFAARIWQKPEVVQAENEAQINETLRLVHQSLGTAAATKIESRAANLGFTEDERMRPHSIDQGLSEKLGFKDSLDEIEQEILHVLQNGRAALKQETGLRRLVFRIEECRTQLAELRDKAVQEQEWFKKRDGELDLLVRQATVISYFSDKYSFQGLDDLITDERDKWIGHLNYDGPDFRTRYRNGGHGRFRNKIRPDEVENLCWSEAAQFLRLVPDQFFSIPGKTGVTLLEEISKQASRDDAAAYQKTNDALAALGLKTCNLPLGIDALQLPRLVREELEYSRVPKRILGMLWEWRYDADEAIEYWHNHVRSKLESKIDVWVTELRQKLKDFSLQYAKTRRDVLAHHVREQQQKLSDAWRPKLLELEKVIRAIDIIAADLRELHDLANRTRNALTTSSLEPAGIHFRR